MAEGVVRTTRIRKEGTRNLVAAALAAGVRRFIAQSLACWVYADGPQPYSESDPLDLRGDGPYAIVVEGVVALERLTTASLPLEGVVLRYGQIYGPGTGFDEPNGSAPLHVDAAAHAALLAIEGAKPGIFNIAEDTGYVSIAKARRELGWDPGFRLRNRELCEHLDMTRQAVTKHLGLLEAANLVATVWRGREKLHYLNPAPLHEIYERWIGKYERRRLRALSDLKRGLERNRS
jgi:DNA-binding transcriptional ArsR family regulator